MFKLSEHPHRRLNPLSGGMGPLFSPHRTKRPWQGATEKPAGDELPAYDPGCYLCPGNERAGGSKNPAYQKTFFFVNDFSALRPDTPAAPWTERGLLVSETERVSAMSFASRPATTFPCRGWANRRCAT